MMVVVILDNDSDAGDEADNDLFIPDDHFFGGDDESENETKPWL